MAVPETELTTAATDLLLAIVVGAGILWLRRVTMRSGARRIWLTGLLLFALAGGLGGAVHGVELGPDTRQLLWQPLFLLLGSALAFIAAGAIADWRGYPAARRALPFLLAAALLFYAATRLSGGKYIVFILFQAAALALSLAIYGRITFREHRRGAGLILAGLVLSVAGGVLQAMTGISVRMVWEFNHNGLYHLVQLMGVVCLIAGLRHTLGAREDEEPGPR
jgi:hypothetical protein